MSQSYTPAKTGSSRVFFIEGRARADHAPQYKSFMKGGSPEQSFGDVEKIEGPAPNAYDQFQEVGSIQGSVDRATITITGLFSADTLSDLLRLARKRCAIDMQLHFGTCTDPSVFNKFTKAMIFEDARLTNHSTDDLGALSSDENAKINEMTDLSVSRYYEVVPLSTAERAKDVAVNEVIDVVICDTSSCGDCEEESSGCDKIYAVGKSTGASPGTAPDVLYSIDGGSTWAADDIDSMTSGEEPNAIVCMGDYIVIISNDTDSIHYKTKASINDGDASGWTEITTGVVAAGSPNDGWSPTGTFMFVAGDGGYLYGTESPTSGLTVLDAGVATTEDLNAVHAVDDENAVAVGDNGVVVYTENQTGWQTTNTQPVTAGTDLYCVWMKNEKEWFVGTSAGTVYYTLNKGDSWSAVTLPTTYSAIHDIQFATATVGYIAAETSSPAGKLLRTFNGGYSWIAVPEGGGVIPANDKIDAVAACIDDPNFVVGVGLADDGSDGYVVVAEA